MRLFKRLWICLAVCSLFFTPLYAATPQQNNKPTVKIIVNEQVFADNSIIYDYYGNQNNILNIWISASQADTSLMEVFLKNGYKVLGGSPNTTKGNVAKIDIMKATEGDDFTSTNLGDYFKADIVIVGKAVARGVSALKGSQQKSARATVNLRAIMVNSGEIIAVESASATAVAIDEVSAGIEAIREAAHSAALSLVKKIASVKM